MTKIHTIFLFEEIKIDVTSQVIIVDTNKTASRRV